MSASRINTTTRPAVLARRRTPAQAGALILAQVSRLLGVPFVPSRGGIREGAALRLATRRAAA